MTTYSYRGNMLQFLIWSDLYCISCSSFYVNESIGCNAWSFWLFLPFTQLNFFLSILLALITKLVERALNVVILSTISKWCWTIAHCSTFILKTISNMLFLKLDVTIYSNSFCFHSLLLPYKWQHHFSCLMKYRQHKTRKAYSLRIFHSSHWFVFLWWQDQEEDYPNYVL